MSCLECQGSKQVRRYIGHEGRGAIFPCTCTQMLWVKVYRITPIGRNGTFVHSLIGHMSCHADENNLVGKARDFFTQPGEDREMIQVGFFFNAFRSKEVC